jgi:thiosulfate/3-mercaptopyruvate sulfurtransferase
LKRGNQDRNIGNTRKQIFHFLKGILVFLFLLLIPVFVEGQPPPFKNLNLPRLIETSELAPFVKHPSVRIVDMRSSLPDYLKGHLPNAVYLHYETLRVPKNGIPAQGPDRIYLEKLVGDHLSLSNAMWVILYSEKSNPNATFLAWVLDYLGHKRIGIVNGGWEKWEAEKLPVTQAYPVLNPKKFFAKLNPETLIEKKQVLARLSARGSVIVDARPPKQYSGEEGEEIRRGHIPGARNLFWETLLEGDEVRVWRKKEDLEKLFAESGVTKDKEVIVHCRTGREASHLYFTLRHLLGYPNVRLYRGSWVEWSADLSLPVKTGTDP